MEVCKEIQNKCKSLKENEKLMKTLNEMLEHYKIQNKTKEASQLSVEIGYVLAEE